jgi:F0F1-type ATP synthase delta subunit
MKVSRTRLAAVIAERAQQNISAKRLSHEIAAYLLAEGRTDELDSVLRDLMQYRADHGIVEVIGVSAYPLNSEVRHDIEGVARELYPDAKQVIISEEHDENVIGGVTIELANQQLDLSVRAKLNRFRQLTAAPGGA